MSTGAVEEEEEEGEDEEDYITMGFAEGGRSGR
jgi:hypothetical protein